MNNRARWLPVITNPGTLTRDALSRSMVAVAGLAFVGVVTAGPLTAAQAAPQLATQQQAGKSADKRVDNYTFQAQPNIYYCGPASTRIALSAQGKVESQDELAGKLGTTVAGTASAFDITRVLNEALGKDVYKTVEIPNNSASQDEVQRMKADLTKAVDEERIPVVNVIGSAFDADGVQRSFSVGHYLTVVAYDGAGDKVKIADPWQPVGDGTYWIAVSDLANWSASRGYSA